MNARRKRVPPESLSGVPHPGVPDSMVSQPWGWGAMGHNQAREGPIQFIHTMDELHRRKAKRGAVVGGRRDAVWGDHGAAQAMVAAVELRMLAGGVGGEQPILTLAVA